jgi:hypothetical protein
MSTGRVDTSYRPISWTFPKEKKKDVPERLRSSSERRHIHEMESRNVAKIEISRICLSRKEDTSRAIKLETIEQHDTRLPAIAIVN